MQKLYFKKEIDLNHTLKELISVSVDESIDYQIELKGMRALGNIVIQGKYHDGNSEQEFIDRIELDIFALFSKIIDKNDFVLKVENFQYKEINGNLYMDIEVCVYGVKDEKDRIVETKEVKEEIEEIQKVEEDLGIYYFYVVEEYDTYESIANKYHVDCYLIEEYNHHKDLEVGSIIVVPYS